MKISFDGIVKAILPIQEGTSKSGNSWKKQDVVIEDDEKYPNSIVVTLMGDTINPNLVVGNKVKAHLNFKANEYNGRHYNGVTAWKLDVEGTGQSNAQASSQPQANVPPVDDLPF